MSEMAQFYDANQVVRDRIRDMYRTADEVRATRRDARRRLGALARLRLSVGRRLISFGSTLAGQHA